MSQVKIYGCSDHLVELEGDLSEEFTLGSDDSSILVFSDGTMLTISYEDDGVWRIARNTVGTAEYEKVEAPPDDEENYTDIVTLTGDLRWCLAADSASAKFTKREKVA